MYYKNNCYVSKTKRNNNRYAQKCPTYYPIYYPIKFPSCNYNSCQPTEVINLTSGCPPQVPTSFGNRLAIPTWKVEYLVSNRENQAQNVDADLQNPWAVVLFDNELWVSNSLTDSLTNYDIYGNKLLATVQLRDLRQKASFPTGIAINNTGEFIITNNNITKPASLLIANDQDTVHGFNKDVNQRTTTVVINNRPDSVVSIFKGLAIADNKLYLADFFGNKIQVFNNAFQPLVGFDFIDGDVTDPIPNDFAPFNIVYIGCFLYILYAKVNPDLNLGEVDGPGNGYVSIFNFDGTFVKRFYSRGVLNSPWGMIPAPCDLGIPSGAFLIANNGDGKINIFDACGNFVGPMLGQSGLPLEIPGLRGLAPRYCDNNKIFFTAADNNIGILGSLERDQYLYF